MKKGFTVVGAIWLILLATPAIAGEATGQQILVERARITISSFLADPDMSWLRSRLQDAKGILIIPRLIKGAFFYGGSGGSGVLLVRDDDTGEWSQPAFYTIGSASFGLQFGGEVSELVLMIMTQKGIEPLYTSSLKLGADASFAAGPVGRRVEGATALNLSVDYLSFARSKGAFLGISLEGAVIGTRNKWNEAYYGKPVRPVDILLLRQVSNRNSAELRAVVARATKKP